LAWYNEKKWWTTQYQWSKDIFSVPHLRLMIGLATKVFRRVLLLEQELLTIPEHMSLLMVFCGVRIAKYSVLCAVGG
jgi:hypothetical protein